jgi:ubiquinone/menaquinone biosynthesis C-methylase UbiE
MDMHQDSYTLLAAAYVRGKLSAAPEEAYRALCARELRDLRADEIQQLFMLAHARGLSLHRFKRTMQLPRVRKALGILRGLQPDSLLDVGTGRGVFLWPLLDAFSLLPVTCIDCLPSRVADLQAVGAGGISHLQALCADVRALPFADNSFEGVTMLEVLEHVPDTGKALGEVSRVARRFALFSVPSKADNNPEHIHLFTQQQLRTLLREYGMSRVSFDYVLNHLLVLARIDQE